MKMRVKVNAIQGIKLAHMLDVTLLHESQIHPARVDWPGIGVVRLEDALSPAQVRRAKRLLAMDAAIGGPEVQA